MSINEISKLISDSYPFQIETIIPGPRGFVAETFIITCKNGSKYFVKFIDKPTFVAKFLESIDAQEAIYLHGFKRMNCPIRNNHNALFQRVDKAVITIYGYIDAVQSYDYDLISMGELEATLHIQPTDYLTWVRREDFNPIEALKFWAWMPEVLDYSGEGEIEIKLRNYFLDNKERFHSDFALFLDLEKKCKDLKPEFVIVHGDAGGNTLLKSPTDLYLVDWDEIVLAPAERDIWTLCEKTEFMQGYNKIRPAFKTNDYLYSYYVFRAFFTYMFHYLEEILGEREQAYRSKLLNKMLNEYLSDTGWIKAYLESARAISLGL